MQDIDRELRAGDKLEQDRNPSTPADMSAYEQAPLAPGNGASTTTSIATLRSTSEQAHGSPSLRY
eukprot:4881756-Prorocentrum_lima.AAC.1